MSLSREEIREACSRIDREASNHNEEYASGMRLARSMIEEELLE